MQSDNTSKERNWILKEEKLAIEGAIARTYALGAYELFIDGGAAHYVNT